MIIINDCLSLYHLVAAASQCSDGADVAFIVYNAGAGHFNFRLEKEFIKETMAKLVKKSSKFNAAIVLYNDQATVELNFTQKFDMSHFSNAIDSLGSRDKGSNSTARADKALRVTSDHVFGTNGGSRLNMPKIAVLLYEGSFPFSLKGFSLKNVSESLKVKGVRLLIVGIDVQVYQPELDDIIEFEGLAGYIIAPGFSSLPLYEDFLVDDICLAIG